MLDLEAGKPNRLCMVAYPEGSSWEKSESVIYANPTAKGDSSGNRSLDGMIRYDDEQHRAKSPKVVIENGETWTNRGRKVRTRKFTGAEGNHECVAYIEEKNAVVFLVLSSRTPEGYRKSLPALKAMVENYQLVSNEVHIERQLGNPAVQKKNKKVTIPTH